MKTNWNVLTKSTYFQTNTVNRDRHDWLFPYRCIYIVFSFRLVFWRLAWLGFLACARDGAKDDGWEGRKTPASQASTARRLFIVGYLKLYNHIPNYLFGRNPIDFQ